jgi:hypothetical protein
MSIQGLPYGLKPSRKVCAFHHWSESMRMQGYNRAAGHVCMVQVILRAKRDTDLHVILVQCVSVSVIVRRCPKTWMLKRLILEILIVLDATPGLIFNKTGTVRTMEQRGTFVQTLLPWKSNKYYVFWVCVCSLIYPAFIAHGPCYVVICDLSDSTFFHIIT